MHPEAAAATPEPIQAEAISESLLLKFGSLSKVLTNLIDGRHPTPPERVSGFEFFLQKQFHTRIAPLVDKKHGPSAVERAAKDVFSKIPAEERDSLEASAAEAHRKELQEYEDQLKDIYGFQNDSERDMCIFMFCIGIQHSLMNLC